MSLARRDQREVPGAKRVKRRRAGRQRGEENMLVAATLAKLGLAQFHMILYRNSRYADIKSCTQVIGEETSSLSCYICGDNNLPEFGECSTQFKYDCTNYASRFGQDVRMFCRTTRHRAENGTYTIMKECISEKDHHMTFPEKNYKLDEECDLIDVKGKEVAYCLCRSPLCNQAPIAEQFMAFEEKHPELFGDTSADDDSDLTSGESRKSPHPSPSSALPNMPAPQQSAAFGVSSLNQQRPIVPVNDPRLSASGDIRRSQLPSRGAETADANKGVDAAAGLSGNGQPVSRGQFVSIKQSGEQIKISPTKQGVMMRCEQCAERENAEAGVCQRPVVVECTHERALCLTRRISLDGGISALEKMCILPETAKAWFGDNSAEDGCATNEREKTLYCLCSSPLCNQPALNIQMVQFESAEQQQQQQREHSEALPPAIPPQSRVAPPAPPASPEPILSSLNRSIQQITPTKLQPPLAVSPPLIRPPPSNEKPSSVENKVPAIQQPIPPANSDSSSNIDYPIENIPEVKPIVPVVMQGRPTQTESPQIPVSRLKCSVCNETVADSLQDCQLSATAECDSDASKYVCITSQAKMSDDRYTIEKRCISVEDVSGMLEKAEGCGTAGDVNFCLCKTDLCNGASLLQQARLQGFQESLNEQPTSDKIPQGPEIAKSNSDTPPPVFLGGENEETTQLDRKAIDTAVGRLEEEERKLEERRKQWIVGSGEDISSVGLRSSFISLCTTGITFIILHIL